MQPVHHYLTYDDGEKILLIRDSIILTFFSKSSFYKRAEEILTIFEIWLDIIPKETLKWAEIGASADEPKKINSKTLARCRDLLTKKAKKDIIAFSIMGKEAYNPSYALTTIGSNEDILEEETNLLEMRFPADFLQQFGIDEFIALSIKMAESLSYDTGYASLALNWAVESELASAAKIIMPIVLRHPGFDVHWNEESRYEIDTKSRGARWLTFLSSEHVNTLGGQEQLQKQLDPGVELLTAGQGIALRAGLEPTPGDFNRQDNLPLIRSVAQAIEEVTYFGDTAIARFLFLEDEEKFERWERRFLD